MLVEVGNAGDAGGCTAWYLYYVVHMIMRYNITHIILLFTPRCPWLDWPADNNSRIFLPIEFRTFLACTARGFPCQRREFPPQFILYFLVTISIYPKTFSVRNKIENEENV